MRKLPINISTFSTLRTQNCIYVDKTENIYNSLIHGIRFHFLSRPRRFGKSLLISTLEELYSGNRTLFKGLWIDTYSNYDWPQHPVIRLDFSMFNIQTPEGFKTSFVDTLNRIAEKHSIDLHSKSTIESKVQHLIESLSQKNNVVILIDEYDYPLVHNITNLPLAKELQTIIKGFFSTIKGMDKYLRDIFVTGVSKFAKTSVFSGMNNLNDITLDPIAATLVGYTEEELEHYFHEHIQHYADTHTLSYQEAFNELRSWYNGYRFSRDPVKVYNPFSIHYCLTKQSMINYWFKSATPTFLITLLQEKKVMPEEIENIKLASDDLDPVDIDNIRLGPLLCQTGYLTFSDYNKQTDVYTLIYPNKETRQSFNNYLLSMLANTNIATVAEGCHSLIDALNHVNIPRFCDALQSIFAHISSQQLIHANESLYHALFQLLGILLGINIDSEVSTDKGRIDMVLSTKTTIFIIEVKLDIPAQEALEQIENRRYYEKYQTSNKKVILLGITFNTSKNKLTIDYAFRQL